jgi:alpha-tubulin suppressor-like RCC1 family protein
MPLLQEPVIHIGCGDSHTAVVTQHGKVVCCGFSVHGQCNVPDNLTNVVAIDGGGGFCAALTAEGRIVCWV